ncbi:MAG: fibronectin type III domain-containing protein [Bacteroidales bacterium]|nr:fibronectin type III domain-containing protein [Bacteroidales bacterium]
MKKFFALLVTLLVMTFCVKAQVLMSEGFESGTLPPGWTVIDNDDDGYCWTMQPVDFEGYVSEFAHSGNGLMASASYMDYIGDALYPDDWLITPQIEIPTSGAILSWYAASYYIYPEPLEVLISTTGNTVNDFTSPAVFSQEITNDITEEGYNLYSVDLSDYAGESIYIAFVHRECTDNFWLFIDDIMVMGIPSSPTIVVTPQTVDFGTVQLGDTSNVALTVTGYSLTDNITATTSDPFLLTTDGIVFSYSATLPSSGGNLSVVYVPSNAGEETGTVTLSSTGATDVTIDLTGSGLDCDNITLPLSESFEDVGSLACWTAYTMGTNNISLSTQFATEGTRSLMFSSYDYDYSGNYDQYMITPKLPMGVSKMVSFDYRSNSLVVEKFKVGYSTADEISLSDFTWGPVVNVTNTTDWMTYVDAAIPDDAQYIAILYCPGASCYYLHVDNFSVLEVTDCMSPVLVNASNITQNSASINWNPVGTETAWDVVVVEHGVDPDTGYPEYTEVRPYPVENLSPNTQYDAYVMAECESGSSVWSAAATFTTTPDCSNPTAPVVTDITGTSAVISWNAAPYGVTSYTVEYGVAESGSTEQVVVEDATTVTLTGLEPQTDYEFTITSVCNSETLEPTPVAGTFTTGCLVVVDFTIGNGTSTNSYLPSYSYYKYSYTQQIFLASELNGQSMINSLSFEMGAVVSQRNIQIYLMHTSATNSTNFLPATNAQLVYSGSQTMVTGWNTYNFNTPFQYNGTDNLALIIVDMTGSWTSGNNAKVHDGPSDCSRYIYRDESAYSTDTIPTSGTSSSTISQRLNVKFGECDESSTCVAPIITDFTFTATEATITWSPGYQESAWTLEYKADSDADWTDIGSVTSPYTITDLIPNNDYQIRLYSDCGGGELSTPAMRAFTTPCAAIVPPFTEDFSGWDTNPSACWSRYSGLASSVFTGTALSSVTDGWVFDRDNEFSGFPLGHPIVNVYGTSCNYWLVSPAIDLTGMENPELTFDLALTDYNNADPIEDPTAQADDKFMVVVSTDNGATWSQANATIWDNAGSIKVYNSISSQGEEITIPLADYIDQTIMIAFYAESTVDYNGDNDLHITNVHVGERATCAKPQVIMLDSATASELSFSWIPAGDEAVWQYVCLPQGTEISEDADWQFAYDTFAVVGDLDANTLYTIYVKAYCNDSEQSEAKTLNVRTGCGQINVPFYESFESFSASYGAPIYCWTKETDYVYGDYPNVCTDAAATGTKSLFFYAEYGYYNLIVTPQFESTVDLNTLQVALKMKSNGMVSLLVGVMTDPTDINTFVTVDTMHVTNTSDWNFNEVSLASYTGTGSYVALKYVSSSYDGLYVDDINIDLIPTCPRPTQFVAESTPNDTVLLSWVDAEGDLWDVIYGPTGFDPETSTDAVLISGIEETSYAVDGLTEGVYDFYVRRDCGSGEVSPWSFSPATASPFTITMGVSGSRSVTGCGMTILDNGGVNGNYSSNCNYYLTVYPSDPDSLVAVSGTLIAESASWDYLIIYDGTSQSPANELYHSTQTSSTPVTVGPVVSTEGPVTIYFHSDGGTEYAGFVLNVNCVAAPTCRKPTNIAVSNITTSSADISWTAVGTGSSWNIEYGPAGFAPGTGTVDVITSNPYTLSGLNASTMYSFRLQTNCDDGGSEWSDIITFATECDIITVPYAENFDNYTTTASSSTVPSTYPNDVMPICWSFLNRSNSSSDYPNVFISSYSSYAVSGNCLFFKSSETTPVYAVLPEFSNEISDLALTFSYRNEGVSEYNGTLYAGYLTDPSDAATFTAVETCTQTTTLTSIQNVTFANAPAGSRIAFKYAGGSSNNYYLSIDNVIVDINTTPPTPTCDVPTNLSSSNVLYNSADIAWTAGGSESAWNLQWRAQGGNWTAVNNLTTANYGLSGLTAQTTYEVQVQAVCDGGTTSDWSASHTFTTPAAPVDPCNVPTNLHVDNITANAATVTWNAGGSETSWEVQYKAQSSGSWQQATVQATNYTMEGLTPETAYEVKVRAICSTDNMSDFVSTTFTTIGTGIDNVTLANSISLMPNPADNYVVLTVNGNINVNEAAVYNAFGQKVQEIQLTDNQARIDLTNMASGMYFVRVAGDNAMATKKFIKK